MTDYVLEMETKEVYSVDEQGYTKGLDSENKLVMYGISYSPVSNINVTGRANALHSLIQSLPKGYLWALPKFETKGDIGYIHIEGLKPDE